MSLRISLGEFFARSFSAFSSSLKVDPVPPNALVAAASMAAYDLQFSSDDAPSLLLTLPPVDPPPDDELEEFDGLEPPPSLTDELSFLSAPQATSKTSKGIATIETRTWLRDISPPEH
jgi:hypothetical protein